MNANLLSYQVPEIPFINEVAFEYKKELYKVHVNVLVEKDETFYKLYFKNNIGNTNKSLMQLSRKVNSEGVLVWTCKADYFSYVNNEIATIAGSAIDRILKGKKY
jgi:hypothetical protein